LHYASAGHVFAHALAGHWSLSVDNRLFSGYDYAGQPTHYCYQRYQTAGYLGGGWLMPLTGCPDGGFLLYRASCSDGGYCKPNQIGCFDDGWMKRRYPNWNTGYQMFLPNTAHGDDWS
jgi:hypothetical protein